MSNPLVSVIIPCYNAETYIAKSILSITKQSYTNLEIIIVDDASMDGSAKTIKKISDPRIHFFTLTENTKKIGAVALAIKEARGSYIAFQDADDWSEPDRITKQLYALKANPDAGICFTGYKLYNSAHLELVDDKPIATNKETIRKEFTEFGQHNLYTKYKPTMCATMLCKAQLLKESGGYHPFFAGRVAEDIHLIYRLLKKTDAIAIPMPLYNITQSPNSLTTNQFEGKNAKAAYTWELLSRIIESDKKGIDLLTEENKDLLFKTELEACESSLIKSIQEKNLIIASFENSSSYKIGRYITYPVRILKELIRKK